MKKLILLFLFILAGAYLGYWISQDPGYILIRYTNTTVETSLWFAFLLLIFAFFIIHMLLRFLSTSAHAGRYFVNWRRQRAIKKQNLATENGLLYLAASDWKKARQHLLRHAKRASSPLVNYLAAAYVAQQQGRLLDRDKMIASAHAKAPNNEFTVIMLQAQLQIEANEWEQACAVLQRALTLEPKHRHALFLLQQVYQSLQEWDELYALLPTLSKLNILDKQQYHTLAIATAKHLIASQGPSLTTFWHSLPRSLKTEPVLILAYSKQCIALRHFEQASRCIVLALGKQWIDHLVSLYIDIPTHTPEQQLSQLNQWNRQYPNETEILLALSRVYCKTGFFEQSKHFVCQSLEVAPQRAAYHLLAQIMEEQGDINASQRYLKQALASAT